MNTDNLDPTDHVIHSFHEPVQPAACREQTSSSSSVPVASQRATEEPRVCWVICLGHPHTPARRRDQPGKCRDSDSHLPQGPAGLISDQPVLAQLSQDPGILT